LLAIRVHTNSSTHRRTALWLLRLYTKTARHGTPLLLWLLSLLLLLLLCWRINCCGTRVFRELPLASVISLCCPDLTCGRICRCCCCVGITIQLHQVISIIL
jgi:hypothetical protein